MVGDKKGAFVDTDSGYVHASFGHIDDERLKRFITRLANTSSKLLDKTKATRLCLILPKDMARLLTKQLPLADQKKLIATKTKDLTKQPFLTVILSSSFRKNIIAFFILPLYLISFVSWCCVLTSIAFIIISF
jgi:hypothetical protein